MTREEENKLIERTAKFHAYQMVWMWARGLTGTDHGSAAWYAKEKMEGHREYVENHSHRYDYATSTFVLNYPKKETRDE